MRKMTVLVGLIVAAIPAVALAPKPAHLSPAVGKNVCSKTASAFRVLAGAGYGGGSNVGTTRDNARCSLIQPAQAACLSDTRPTTEA